MAMAAVLASCVSRSFVAAPISSALNNHRVVPSHAPLLVQCFSLRVLPDSFTHHCSSDSADVGFRESSRISGSGRDSRKVGRPRQRPLWKILAGLKETELTEQQWGPPVRLGTAQLPEDVDLKKLQFLLYQQFYLHRVTFVTRESKTGTDVLTIQSLGRMALLSYIQWGNSITQNANLPLPVPLKVDKIEGGVRLAYIRVTDGKVEDIVHIDVLVIPPSANEPKAMFRAFRNGELKNSVPPGERVIMQSLLAALKKSLTLARTSS